MVSVEAESAISFEYVEGGLAVSDPILGTRIIPHNNPIALVKDQFKYLSAIRLLRIRKRQEVSQHLIDDIATYDYILTNEDPDARARDYFLAKSELMNGNPLKEKPFNYQVAEHLGWDIREKDL